MAIERRSRRRFIVETAVLTAGGILATTGGVVTCNDGIEGLRVANNTPTPNSPAEILVPDLEIPKLLWGVLLVVLDWRF